MKYRLIIDKSAEEEIVATVHAPSSLTREIEDLVRNFSGVDSIMGYKDDEMRRISLSDVECITVLDRRVVAVDREGERYNVLTRTDEATDEEIVLSVDAILNSTVCLNTVTESIQNDESISSSVQESTESMNDETKDEIKDKLDAALLENPDNEEQYSYLADLFGITLGEN